MRYDMCIININLIFGMQNRIGFAYQQSKNLYEDHNYI
jgi:hypothetical protein